MENGERGRTSPLVQYFNGEKMEPFNDKDIAHGFSSRLKACFDTFSLLHNRGRRKLDCLADCTNHQLFDGILHQSIVSLL